MWSVRAASMHEPTFGTADRARAEFSPPAEHRARRHQAPELAGEVAVACANNR